MNQAESKEGGNERRKEKRVTIVSQINSPFNIQLLVEKVFDGKKDEKISAAKELGEIADLAALFDMEDALLAEDDEEIVEAITDALTRMSEITDGYY